jgi:hypothetical protein
MTGSGQEGDIISPQNKTQVKRLEFSCHLFETSSNSNNSISFKN